MNDIDRKHYLLPEPDPDTLSGYRSMWSSLNEFGLSEAGLRDFLIRADVQAQIVNAILQTEAFENRDWLGNFLAKGVREHAFIGYADPFSDEVKITPLFEGDDRSLALHDSFSNFKSAKRDPLKDEDEIDFISSFFEFHTHPTRVISQRAGNLLAELIPEKTRQTQTPGMYSYPSRVDLERMLQIGQGENPAIVTAIGIHEEGHYGSMLLLSFRDFNAYSRLNTMAVRKSNVYELPLNKAIDFSRDIGLNAFNLRVNLHQLPHLDPLSIERASRALTSRS